MTGTAAVTGGVAICLGTGIDGNGTGVTFWVTAAADTGVGVLDADLVIGIDADVGTGMVVSLGVMMSSSIDEANFPGLGRLQCTQQQSL